MSKDKECCWCDTGPDGKGVHIGINDADLSIGKNSFISAELNILTDPQHPLLYIDIVNNIELDKSTKVELGRSHLRDCLSGMEIPINYCPFCGRKLNV